MSGRGATRHFVVAGCGRSGTGYIARALNRLGYPCLHERAVRPEGFVGWGDQTGDVSWFAAPYLPTLPTGTVVLHQVREPHAVIESWYRIGFFADRWFRNILANPKRTASYVVHPRRLTSRYRELMSQRGVVTRNTSVFEEPDELSRCHAYYLEWNRLTEECATASGHDYFRYRIEDLDSGLMSTILEMLGGPTPDAPTIADVLDASPEENRKPEYRSREVVWPGFDSFPGLARMAERYGYSAKSEVSP